jgi:threonine synthase
MVSDMKVMGSEEGISAAPEGAASLSAVRQLIAAGTIKKNDVVVLFNTGGALKYLDLIR